MFVTFLMAVFSKAVLMKLLVVYRHIIAFCKPMSQ